MEMMWVVWKLEMMRKVEECSVLLRWSWVQFSVSTDEWESWESPWHQASIAGASFIGKIDL